MHLKSFLSIPFFVVIFLFFILFTLRHILLILVIVILLVIMPFLFLKFMGSPLSVVVGLPIVFTFPPRRLCLWFIICLFVAQVFSFWLLIFWRWRVCGFQRFTGFTFIIIFATFSYIFKRRSLLRFFRMLINFFFLTFLLCFSNYWLLWGGMRSLLDWNFLIIISGSIWILGNMIFFRALLSFWSSFYLISIFGVFSL